MKKHLWLKDQQRSQNSGVQFHTVTNHQAALIRTNPTQPKEAGFWLLCINAHDFFLGCGQSIVCF